MRIEIACFTGRGRALAEKLAQALAAAGDEARAVRCGAGGGDAGVNEWAAGAFRAADALVFVGAAGIAVRAVAPLLAGKMVDPAVVVLDDGGRFAVSLLSGHVGGANALAERVAGMVGAVPVVTTATDGAGVFAVDAWAAGKRWFIANPERVKRVSAKALAGETLRVRTEFRIAEALPDGVVFAEAGEADFVVGVERLAAGDAALLLVPPAAVLGAGCRRGVSAAALEEAFRAFCDTAGIVPEAFSRACSVDLKKDEAGLKEFCARRGMAFETFPAGALAGVEGEFGASAFVESVAGVGNVCARAAVLGSGGGRLLAGKTVINGIALAAACGRCV